MKRIATSIVTVALACLGMAVEAKGATNNDRFMVAQISPSFVAGSSTITYHVSVTNDILSGPNHFIRNVAITVPSTFTGSGANGAFIAADASGTNLWKVQSIAGHVITFVTVSSTDVSLSSNTPAVTFNITAKAPPAPAVCPSTQSNSYNWLISGNQDISGGNGNTYVLRGVIPSVTVGCATHTNLVLSISPGSIITTQNPTVTLTAALTNDANAAISGKTVTFTLGGEPVPCMGGDPLTISGVATCAFMPQALTSKPYPLTSGSYPVFAHYAGDLGVSPPIGGSDSAEEDLQVTATGTGLEVSDATDMYGGSVTLSAKLTYVTPGGVTTPLSGKTVTFTLNGKPAGSGVTNSNGMASGSSVSLSGFIPDLIPNDYAGYVVANFATDGTYSAQTGNAHLIVKPLSQTITFAQLPNVPFGTAPFTVSATGGASGNPVTFAAAGNCTVSGNTVTIGTTTGSCTITASQAGNTIYSAATDLPNTFNIITNTSATITLGNLIQTYTGGSLTPSVTTNPTGLSYSLTGAPQINASSYTVTATITAPGYTAASDTKTFKISPASSSVTVTGGSFVYNGAAHAATGLASTTAGSLTNPTVVTITYSGSCTVAPTTVTEGTTCTATGTYAGDANHSGSSNTASVTITPAGSSVTVTGGSFVYDTAAHAATGLASTTVGSLTNPTAVTIAYTGSCGSAPTTVAEGTTCTATGTYGGDANHAGSSNTASVTITSAGSSVTVTGGSFVYDTTAHAATGSAGTTVGSLTNPTAVTITYTGSCSSAPTTVTEGTTCVAHGTYAGDANHSGSSNTASVTITPAGSSVTVTSGSFPYDGASHVATGLASTTVGTLTNPTAVTIAYSGSCSSAPITVPEGASCTATGTYAGDANHTGSTSSPASVTITPAGSTVAVTGGSFTYNGAAHAATGLANTTAGTLTNATAVTIAYSGSCTVAPTTVAEGATCTATGTYAGDANHTGSTSSPASVTITPAGSSVTVTGGSFVYNGAAHAATGSASTTGGILTNPTAVVITYSGGCSVAPTTVAEGTGCTATGTYAGDANHTGNSNTASITITPASSFVTVTGGSFPYNGAAHAATGLAGTTAGSLTNPTAVLITYSGSCSVAPTTVTEGTNCLATGTYAGDANHTSSFNTAGVTITAAAQTITFTSIIVAATATSGGTVAFTNDSPAICQVTPNAPVDPNPDHLFTATVTLLANGTWDGCKVRANQNGVGTSYAAAPQATAILGTLGQ